MSENLESRAKLIAGLDPGGNVKAIAVGNDGQLLGSGGSSGGGGDASAANQQTEIAKLISIDNKTTSDPATGSKQDKIINLLESYELLSSNDLVSDQIFSINTIGANCNTFALAVRGNNLSAIVRLRGHLNNNEETVEEINIYKLGNKTFIGDEIDELDIYLCRCNSPVLVIDCYDVDEPFTLDVYKYPAHLYDSILNDVNLLKLTGHASSIPFFGDTGIFGWLATISSGINSSIYSQINNLFTSLGNQNSTTASDDTSSASLISLFKRLLSVKLPTNLENDRIKTQAVLSSTTITGNSSDASTLVIPSTNISDYSFISIQLSGTFNAIITFDFSNNETTWFPGYLYAVNSLNTPFNSYTNVGIYYGNKQAKFFRVRISTYISGTVVGTLSLSTTPTTPGFPIVSLGSGTVDTELPSAVILNDTIGLNSSPSVIGANYLFNGTNWDRARTSGSGRALVDGSGVTQPISSSALTSIDTKTPALGQALSAASRPVVLPAAQITALTPPTTITANLGTIAGVSTEITLSAVNSKLPTGLTVTNNRLLVDTGNSASTITGIYNDTLPNLINNQTSSLQLNNRGELITTFVDRSSITGNITTRDINSTFHQNWGNTNQNIYTGTPTSNSFVLINCSGQSSFSVNISGTFTGTLSFEKSFDDGASWVTTSVRGEGTNYIVTTTDNYGKFVGNSAGCTNIRVRSTAVMTGSATVKIMLGAGNSTTSILNGVRLFDKVSGVEGTIKPASTLPVSTDTATVVTLRDLATVSLFSNIVDTELPPAVILTDGMFLAASPSTISPCYLWNSGAWDRAKSVSSSGQGLGRALISPSTTVVTLLNSVASATVGSSQNLVSVYEKVTAQLIINSGTVTAINCDIEGSLNANNRWFLLATLSDTTDGAAVFSAGKCFSQIRANLKTLTGTSPNISILFGATA